MSIAPTAIFTRGAPVAASVTMPETVYGSGFAMVIEDFPAIPRYVAVTVTSPADSGVTRPATAVATATFDELHDEFAVAFTVVLSDIVAVAVNCVAMGIAGVVPVTATETTVGVVFPGEVGVVDEDPQARLAPRKAAAAISPHRRALNIVILTDDLIPIGRTRSSRLSVSLLASSANLLAGPRPAGQLWGQTWCQT